MGTDPVIGFDDVLAASRRLAAVTARTPVLTSGSLNARVGAEVYLKAENFQRGGAFKLRGAYNKIASLSPEELARGVVTYSSGNHAQGVAIASALMGSTAVIVMPEDAPSAKLDATRGYGAEVVLYNRHRQDREELAAELAAERGLTLVPPYDDPLVMAGQGTVALELLEEVGDLDTLVVPVSGGGLIAGCATAAKAVGRRVRVVGVEPESGDDTKRSLEAGRRVRIPVPDTIADALQVTIPGALTFEVNRRRVDDVVLVADDEIVDAMEFLFERLKVVAEPGGASATAALLAGKVDVSPPHRIGAIVSGGNVGVPRFCSLFG